MSLEIRPYRPEDAVRWDEFVRGHEFGSPFHLIGWKNSIEQTYGYRPHYLLAEAGDRLVGVLPLFLVKNLLLGKALISTPFAVYGGILAGSEEARIRIAEQAASLARTLQVEYLELRNAHPEQACGFSPVSRYVTFRQPITASDEEQLAAIPRKTRRMVRKSLKAGLSTHPTDDLTAFFDLYSRSLRRLGTPCFPRSHFDNLVRNFPGELDIREIHLAGNPVAAVMTFHFRDELHPYYGASDPAYNASAPNNFMYYDLMRWGAAHGFEVFDFGRSKKGTGSYDFKVHWGMEEVELPYEMLLVRRKSLPNFSPANPRFQAAIKLWRRVPLPLTRAVGPWLVKLVP